MNKVSGTKVKNEPTASIMLGVIVTSIW